MNVIFRILVALLRALRSCSRVTYICSECGRSMKPDSSVFMYRGLQLCERCANYDITTSAGR